jgi:hypothetical protein
VHSNPSLLALAGLLALLVAPAPAWACSVCSCGDPLAAAADAHAAGGDLRLALATEYLTQKAGSEGEPGAQDVLDQYTVRVTGAYSPVERLNLVATLPLVRKTMTMDHGGGGTTPVSRQSGLGDVELGARYYLLDQVNFAARRRQGIALSAGVALPTGENGARDAGGARLDEHGQLGTGAFGPYAGLAYRLELDDWNYLVAVSGRYRTENGSGYRFGSALLWTAQAQWSARPWLAFGLGLDGRNAGRDKDGGPPVENTGGLVLAATPAAYLKVYGDLWFDLRAQLPFFSRLAGDQTVGPNLVAGFTLKVL